MYHSVINITLGKDGKMKKAKIKIIIYEKDGKTKVRLLKKKGRNLPVGVNNLYLVLQSKIRKYLDEL